MGQLPVKNEASTEVVSIVTAADPTGVVTRFSQILKISSKLFYINVKYGRKLNAFLASTEAFAGTVYEPNNRILVFGTNNYRGKFSEKMIQISFAVSKLTWKIAVYLLSGVSSIGCSFAIQSEMKFSVNALKFLYYQPKIHLLVYNLVFVDFYYYGTRVALHSNDIFDKVLAVVCLQMLLIDGIRYLNLILDNKVWRIMYLRKKEVEDELQKAVAALKVEKSTNSNNDSTFVKDLDPDQSASNSQLNDFRTDIPPAQEADSSRVLTSLPPDTVKVIDYDATFREISIRVHIMEVMTAPLTISETVYSSKLCRLNFL